MLFGLMTTRLNKPYYLKGHDYIIDTHAVYRFCSLRD